MYNPYSLEGKTILVTGASGGIGRATAIECSKMGASVILTARNKEHLEETLSQMEGSGHSIILADLSNAEQRASLIEQLPALNGVSNNSGIMHLSSIKFLNEETLSEVLNVNTVNTMLLVSALVKKKKLAQGSSIVLTSSISGLGRGSVGNAMYSASKGALTGFLPVAVKELAPRGIRINTVCPAMIETKMTELGAGEGVGKATDRSDLDRYPLGRWGKAEEIAWAIIYLLSDAAAWVTGTNMVLDGGYMTM